MNNVELNMIPVIALANQNINNGLAAEFGIENLNSEIATALKEVLGQERKTAAMAAAMEIVKIVRISAQHSAHLVEEIRQLRAKEDKIKGQLKAIAEAKAYADASSNYVPLLLSMGLPMTRQDGFYEMEDSLKTVPASFSVEYRAKLLAAKADLKETGGKHAVAQNVVDAGVDKMVAANRKKPVTGK